MGIYNFHTWLRKKFPNIYIQIQDNNVYDYIYIDINFILHNAIYESKTEKDFMNRVFSQLDIILSNFIAKKKIYLALDGPSSYAKILLQRKRRSNMNNKSIKTGISSLNITPGTEFMKRIETKLEVYINKFEKQFKLLNPKIDLLSSDLPDEGEIKISKKIIDHGKNDLQANHLIIGNDSDLIVLGMALKPIFNINIFVKGKIINELLSIEKLIKHHAGTLNNFNKLDILIDSNTRDDFVIISLMMGNDYLPKIGFVQYENLWKHYYNFMKNKEDNLIQNNTFTQTFQQFIYYIYKSLSTGFQKINISKMDNFDCAKKYLEGLIWCLNMYKTGVCPMYDYMYILEDDEKKSPHPYELLLYLSFYGNHIEILKSNTSPISSDIYPLVIMPKSGSNLLKQKYQELMNNELKYLYEGEECELCKNSKIKLNDLIKKKTECKKNKNSDENYNKLKKEFSKKYRKYLKHKKTHYNIFTIEDINKIIKYASN